jgi:hypothetical protein
MMMSAGASATGTTLPGPADIRRAEDCAVLSSCNPPHTTNAGLSEIKRLNLYLSCIAPDPSRASRMRRRQKAALARGGTPVKEILRTSDDVLVSAVEALLDDAGIPHVVLDRNMSVLEGSLGILPRRILVDDDYSRSARSLLEDAGLARELRPDVG